MWKLYRIQIPVSTNKVLLQYSHIHIATKLLERMPHIYTLCFSIFIPPLADFYACYCSQTALTTMAELTSRDENGRVWKA